MIGSKFLRPKAGLFAIAFVLASSSLLTACSGRDAASAEKIAAAQDAAIRAEKAAERAEKAANKAERGPPVPFAAEAEPAEQQDNADTQQQPNDPANPDANNG